MYFNFNKNSSIFEGGTTFKVFLLNGINVMCISILPKMDPFMCVFKVDISNIIQLFIYRIVRSIYGWSYIVRVSHRWKRIPYELPFSQTVVIFALKSTLFSNHYITYIKFDKKNVVRQPSGCMIEKNITSSQIQSQWVTHFDFYRALQPDGRTYIIRTFKIRAFYCHSKRRNT